ncbi:ABC transporter ATP-binding protein [Clostridium diolis]|uniref:Heme ABC transporter ATP-binding protein n=1 Tax=Clostridium diolis TaxID=223919 RepID=A0AAV3VYP1_9CLOT|nr:ABC transporter ATP-binding protein [Clostridium diolis]QES71774.1 ABC transporter ATP-binding protein [Clostridium diolis]GEA31115.1 heme ABC transporter ATP-binding protein [Clostridium diolis]
MEQCVSVELKKITKTFGSVIANEDVDLKVHSGEIHALLGENGAGKSTLMNMLSGIYNPDSGSIFIRGKQIQFKSPKESIEYGIGMVHQHFKLVERFTAKENIIAGNKGKFFTKNKEIDKNILDLCEKYNLQIELNKRVSEMSIAEKQMLEIIKVLYKGANILILDEPTAVLMPQEVSRLFNIVKRMKEQGCAVIIITHKLHEVMELCDKVSVLRKGKNIKTLNISDTNKNQLTELMVGHKSDLKIDKVSSSRNEIIYDIKNISVKSSLGINVLDNISFSMKEGEILGVAGVAGSGQKELCEALFGLQKIENGNLIFKGKDITNKSPREVYKKGIKMGLIPEDRLGMGLVGSMGVADNLLLRNYYEQKGLIVKRDKLKDEAKNMIKELEIKTPGIDHPVKQLSGGNIQKILLGREISISPDVLITSYPVRGLDIGATYQIYDLLNKEKEKGVSILFVGEDLDVLLELSDRIMVLCGGKLIGIVNGKNATKEQIGLMMAGYIEEATLEYSEKTQDQKGGESYD